MLSKPHCPCKGCVPPKRHEACWDTCPEYKEWSAPFAKHREERKITNTIKEIMGERIEKAIDKKASMRKRRGRK